MCVSQPHNLRNGTEKTTIKINKTSCTYENHTQGDRETDIKINLNTDTYHTMYLNMYSRYTYIYVCIVHILRYFQVCLRFRYKKKIYSLYFRTARQGGRKDVRPCQSVFCVNDRNISPSLAVLNSL